MPVGFRLRIPPLLMNTMQLCPRCQYGKAVIISEFHNALRMDQSKVLTCPTFEYGAWRSSLEAISGPTSVR
jgi:hypothetical protein